MMRKVRIENFIQRKPVREIYQSPDGKALKTVSCNSSPNGRFFISTEGGTFKVVQHGEPVYVGPPRRRRRKQGGE